MKDLVAVEGVRDNQLIGYGLVVGLAGTGDRQQTVFSNQSLTNMLERMGISVSPTAIRVKNTAAVMVTATLPPFAQPGMHIDTTVAAIGDAANLQGGILLLTSLRGADGQVYAVAQGPVVTGGFVAGTRRRHPDRESSHRGPRAQRRHRGARGAFGGARRRWCGCNCARPISPPRRASSRPSTRSSQAGQPARAENSGLVSVAIPPEFAARATEFIAELEKPDGGGRPAGARR